MKKFATLFLLITNFCTAQSITNISQQVSQQELKKNLYYLASAEMEGRAMATKGDTLASQFIAGKFKESKLKAPYKNNSYFQAVVTNKKVITNASIIIGNNVYENLNGWGFALRTTEAFKLSNVPVVFAGYGLREPSYNDFNNIDVKGKAVLLLPGQPRDTSGKYLLSGTTSPARVASYQTILKELGAVAVLMYNPRFRQDSAAMRRQTQPLFINPYATPSSSVNLPVLSLSEDRVNQLLAGTQTNIRTLQAEVEKTMQPQPLDLKSTISADVNVAIEKGIAPNVIGVIEGTDKNAEAIILSAHHDHVGKQGERIFYGAVDNASGTVAIMEIARLMSIAKQQGLRPKRTIIFASYTGEELGLLGSHHLANNPVVPIEKTWAVLNIDMMGRVDTFYSGRRPDSNYAYILVQDTLGRNLRNTVYKANETVNLKLDTHYEQPQFKQRRLQGSDQYPFYLKGVPFIRIDCGFSKDYHQATDTPDKINYQLLANQTQLAFLTTWNLAND